MTATASRRADAEGVYPGIHVEYFDSSHRYKINGVYVPSVTTVLGILDKPGLPPWAAKITAQGCLDLMGREGYVTPYDLDIPEGATHYVLPRVTADPGTGRWLFDTADLVRVKPRRRAIRVYEDMDVLPGWRILQGQLAQERLDHYSTTSGAAERGTDVHEVWENWNLHRTIPNLDDYPADRRGHMRAMVKFIVEHDPVPHETEAVVGSLKHGYAGRLDTVVMLRNGDDLDMIDVKTGTAVHPNTYYPQLAGYEIARRECGLQPTRRRGILRLGADGEFELAWSDSKRDDFLSVLACWKSQQKWAKSWKKKGH